MPNRSVLHDVQAAAGAVIATVCDREVPISYGDPAAEYAAVRQGVGLLDRSDVGVLEVTGRDRSTFLHAMLSNDTKGLAPGRGCAAALLDIHGKVQAMLTVLALDDRLLVLTSPGMAEKVMQDLDKYLFSEKAYFRNASGEFTLLMLAGPGAPSLAERVAGRGPGETPWVHATGTIDGAEARLVRGGGETGEPEVWTMVSADRGADLWRALVAAGARPVGVTAYESLRIEAGTPLPGHDVDDTVLLPEIPCAHLVSYTKGCYLGQEVVVRIRDRGHVNRRLCGLVVDGDGVPSPGEAVHVDGAAGGHVTSATWSYGLRCPVALGFLRRQHAEPGTRVVIGEGADASTATVSTLPFAR